MVLGIVALVVSVVSAGGVVWSVIYARSAAAAAVHSAAAAAITAGLDTDRRHAELTPRFRITCEPANPGIDSLRMSLQLLGPAELQRLDEVTVEIRDDHPWRAEGNALAGGPTREQIAQQIWGPYQFRPGTGPNANSFSGIPGADPTGRRCPAGALPVGEALPFFLEPNRPPPWSAFDQAGWLAAVGSDLRLRIECRRDGHEPWVLTGEVVIDHLSQGVTDIPRAIG